MHIQSPDCPVIATCKGNGCIWQLWRLKNMSMTSMTSFASLRNMSLQAASGQIWEEINQISRCNAKCGHFRWKLCTIWAKMHLFQILSWRLVTTWWHESSIILTPLTVTTHGDESKSIGLTNLPAASIGPDVQQNASASPKLHICKTDILRGNGMTWQLVTRNCGWNGGPVYEATPTTGHQHIHMAMANPCKSMVF